MSTIDNGTGETKPWRPRTVIRTVREARATLELPEAALKDALVLGCRWEVDLDLPHHPETIASAAIHVAALASETPVSQYEIADACGVTPHATHQAKSSAVEADAVLSQLH